MRGKKKKCKNLQNERRKGEQLPPLMVKVIPRVLSYSWNNNRHQKTIEKEQKNKKYDWRNDDALHNNWFVIALQDDRFKWVLPEAIRNYADSHKINILIKMIIRIQL